MFTMDLEPESPSGMYQESRFVHISDCDQFEVEPQTSHSLVLCPTE
jgi:hypothetical protein